MKLVGDQAKLHQVTTNEAHSRSAHTFGSSLAKCALKILMGIFKKERIQVSFRTNILDSRQNKLSKRPLTKLH